MSFSKTAAAKSVYSYAKDNPDQVKKGVNYARENPDKVKKAYNVGSDYYKNNEDPSNPQTMGKAAYKYARENPEEAKKGAQWARDNPEAVKKGMSDASNAQSGGSGRTTDNAKTASASSVAALASMTTYKYPPKIPNSSKYPEPVPASRSNSPSPTTSPQLSRPTKAGYNPPKPPRPKNYGSNTSLPPASLKDPDDELSRPYEPPPSRFAKKPAVAPVKPSTYIPNRYPTTTTTTTTSSYVPRTTPSSTYSSYTPDPDSISIVDDSHGSNTDYGTYGTGGDDYATPEVPGVPARPAREEVEFTVTALYDYEPLQEGDLAFKAGDVITVTHCTPNTDDWWQGRAGGMEGNFPANYVSR